MITAIELENFKAFGERQRLEIRPITLLYGKNSSGKSSCIRALQMLRQTARGARSPREVVLSGPRADVDLGSFFELVHGHDTSRACLVSVELSQYGNPRWRVNLELSCESQDTTPIISGLRIDTHAAAGQWHPRAVLKETDERSGKDRGPVWEDAWVEMTPTIGDHQWPILDALPIDEGPLLELLQHGQREAMEFLDAFVKQEAILPIRNLAPGIEAREWRGHFITLQHKSMGAKTRTKIENVFQDLWRSQTKVSEAQLLWQRGLPSRLIAPRGSLLGHVHAVRRPRGEEQSSLFARRQNVGVNTWQSRLLEVMYSIAANHAVGAPSEALNVIGEDIVRARMIGPLREPPSRILAYESDHNSIEEDCQTVSKFLPRFGVDSKLIANRLQTVDRHRDVGYELRLVSLDGESSGGESWADVGVGVSQVVPVIRECVQSSGLICVEQPELHLHPAAQASLADFFVELTTSSEASETPKTRRRLRGPAIALSRRVVAETHSEHLVLRLRQLVREGKIGPDSVSINVVEQSSGGSRIRRVNLDHRGRFIDPWPGGFFPERGELL